MAKKSKDTLSVSENCSVFDLVKSVSDSAEIIKTSSLSEIKEWIPSGNYILNACLSGNLFGAIPSNRITIFSGNPGSGKSYLCMSICREAQLMGYTPVYMDSEGAIDKTFCERLGIDTSNFIIQQVNTINEVSNFIASLCKKIESIKEEDRPKMILVLDSLGNLTSEKERDDTLAKSDKRDMTKQQNVKALFRVNSVPLSKLQIPFLVTSHCYQCVSGNTNIIMGDKSIKNIKCIKKGDIIMTLDGEREVLNTTSIEDTPIHYNIKFSDDYEVNCTPGHKFMCENEDGTTRWVTAEDLSENDIIKSNLF